MEKRDIKALELFENGEVKRVNKDTWTVKGSRNYTVRRLDKYNFSCTCKDHQYRFEICKHIRSVKLDELHSRKEGFKKHEKFFNNKFKNLQMKKRAIKERINKLLQQNKEHMKLNGTKSKELSKEARRQHHRLLEVESELKKFQKSRTLIVG